SIATSHTRAFPSDATVATRELSGAQDTANTTFAPWSILTALAVVTSHTRVFPPLATVASRVASGDHDTASTTTSPWGRTLVGLSDIWAPRVHIWTIPKLTVASRLCFGAQPALLTCDLSCSNTATFLPAASHTRAFPSLAAVASHAPSGDHPAVSTRSAPWLMSYWFGAARSHTRGLPSSAVVTSRVPAGDQVTE